LPRIAARQPGQFTDANQVDTASERGTVSPHSAVIVPFHQLDDALR
jgi:hypothetical protein